MKLHFGACRVAALLAVFFMTTAVTNAHKPKSDEKVNTFGYDEGTDSISVYETLHKNAPDEFRIIGIPSAAFVSKNQKFYIGIGGFVKGVVGYDFGHPIDSPDEFISGQIPMTPSDGDGGRFNLSAQQSHIFLNFIALPGSRNEIGAFISANFLNNYVPVLQFAYLRYRGFQMGWNYTLFSDPACAAPAIDYEGPCSSTAVTVAGLRYNLPLDRNENWLFSAGVELPQVSYTTIEGKTRQVYSRMPDIPLALRHQWDEGGSWTRFSAIFRGLTYRNEVEKRNHTRFGYGLQLSGGWYFLDRFTLFYQGVWGKGIGSLIQDTADQGMDMTPTTDDSSLAPVMSWGAMAALQYDINEKFYCSATYSQVRTYAKPYTDGSTPFADQYKYAQYVSANFFWHISSIFETGIEYIWGRRADYDGLKHADNRIQAMFQLSF